MKPGRRRVAGAALLAVVALQMGGCATARRSDGGSDWLAGRLALKVDATGARPFSSAFELRGDADNGELRLSSPLGSVVATASWAQGEAKLVTSEGERRYADLDGLARDALGEALPLRAMPAWLHGEPWTGAPHAPAGDGFDQLGWHIGLARYAEGWLEATRAGPPAVTLRARLDRTP